MAETNLVFTLLLVNNVKCSKCFNQAEYILLGKENEFLGFFCKEHGEDLHKSLETKYSFENEVRKDIKPRIKRKKYYLKGVKRKRT